VTVLLGVDVGGTTTAAGLVTRDGAVRFEQRAATHAAGPGSAWQTIVALVERALRDASARGVTVEGIGVGIPGVVDTVTGRVGDEAAHVEDLRNQPVGPRLAERFGLPVFVDNDVNALALGEHYFGLGRGMPSLVVLAAGTGFGAGIVLDGALVRGAHGFGGEFGHVPVKFDGVPCFCGGRGCLAAYASGRGIADRARDRVAGDAGAPLLARAGGDPVALTAPVVFAAAAEGDPDAAAVVSDACRALGAMIAVIVNGLNPDVVVVTGGVAGAYAPLEATVLRWAAEHAFPRALAGTTVRLVAGDKGSTMRGAAALVLYETARRR